jgi:retinol dehydrogenase-16
MIFIIGFALLVYVGYRLYQHFFPAPDIDPRGKYVLISGCDTGFGNALAIELDKRGFNVFAGVYSTDSKTGVTNQLSSRATVFLLDITRQQEIDSAYEMIKGKTNVLHALVNNAGISTGGHIDWITTESMRQVMDINFFAHVAMTKKFLPLLIAKRDSRVVNICSVAGFISTPSGSAYSASKYALESFSDCLRREMFAWGLHVSIIEPGIMKTPIIQKHMQAVREIGTQLSVDARERWGEEFITSYFEKLKNNILVKFAEDPNKVVRALQHAVTNTAPCIRYRPGWQSKFVYFPLACLPTWLADAYFVKTRALPVQPVGIKKQLKL